MSSKGLHKKISTIFDGIDIPDIEDIPTTPAGVSGREKNPRIAALEAKKSPQQEQETSPRPQVRPQPPKALPPSIKPKTAAARDEKTAVARDEKAAAAESHGPADHRPARPGQAGKEQKQARPQVASLEPRNNKQPQPKKDALKTAAKEPESQIEEKSIEEAGGKKSLLKFRFADLAFAFSRLRQIDLSSKNVQTSLLAAAMMIVIGYILLKTFYVPVTVKIDKDKVIVPNLAAMESVRMEFPSEKPQSWPESFRDPMMYSEAILASQREPDPEQLALEAQAAEKVEKIEEQVKEKIKFMLLGVLLNPNGNSTALINRKMLRQGDTIEDFTVTKITSKVVSLKDKEGNSYELMVGDELEI
jgi:hypothetical protein